MKSFSPCADFTGPQVSQVSQVRLKRTRRGRGRVRIQLEFGAAVVAIAQEVREGHTSRSRKRDFMGFDRYLIKDSMDFIGISVRGSTL